MIISRKTFPNIRLNFLGETLPSCREVFENSFRKILEIFFFSSSLIVPLISILPDDGTTEFRSKWRVSRESSLSTTRAVYI